MTRHFLFPILLGMGGMVILCSLGTWQVQRLEWKQGIIATINERIWDTPVEIPLSPRSTRDNYLSVMAMGDILAGELFVLLSRDGFGPGFRIITPFEVKGQKILLDRGFIPESQRPHQRKMGSVEVIGNLHWPDETDVLFTPQPEGDLWFAREVEAMARHFNTDPVLLVARQEVPGDPAIIPWPIDSNGIPNNHLNYAITWFLLAMVWLGMTAMWIWRINRGESLK